MILAISISLDITQGFDTAVGKTTWERPLAENTRNSGGLLIVSADIQQVTSSR